MSYNCDHVEYLTEGRLTIKRMDAFRLLRKYGEELPEGNLLEELPLDDGEDDDMVVIEKPWWYGEGSGRAYDLLVDTILPLTKGHAQLLFTWEGGDDHTGLDVRDGVVTKKKPKISL